MLIDSVWILLALPLAGATINALAGARLGRRATGWIACGAVGLTFVFAVVLFAVLAQRPAEERAVEVTLWRWISVEQLRVDVRLLWDPLSAWMALVVTSVGFLIHVYSAGYMADDARYARYFAFLNGFVFMMLLLVLSSDYILLFVGWEGVGLASYLLIGFWFDRKIAADAGKKAFLLNRIGDFGLLIAIFWLFSLVRTTHFQTLFPQASAIVSQRGAETLNIICLLMLLAATGKSAQIPLYVWLPDAMEGPTPVSALIHAATMVTAGVYMIARSWPLFALSPNALTWVAVIGAATAFLAATIALTQTDLKRILAYSTISQLGYMFLGVGVGAYASGIFHLTTHAFFKALLFLGAGSVMHALHGELDIRRMGGLREKIPTTYRTFLIGAAALAGFPLLSGFFSKDEILWLAWQRSPLLWLVGITTALLTAIYSFRVVFVPFWGDHRGGDAGKKRGKAKQTEAHGDVHESPRVMTTPLIILAVLALFGGLLGLPRLSLIEGWLEPVFHTAEKTHQALEFVFIGLSAVVALTGIYVAYRAYVADTEWPARLRAQFGWLHQLVSNKYYVDEIYTAVIANPLRDLANWFSRVTDGRIIEGLVNGLAAAIGVSGEQVRRAQTGLVGNYALSLLVGAVALVGYFLLR
ncbi:MAG: NADH-quinone oxidoreductase subunit L [Anaerolineae bacterium]|nr:NADH-quinone oxidoreductase subunit L [Anaerolineae bacterium]